MAKPADVTANDLDFVKIDQPLVELAVEVLKSLQRMGLSAVTAESCTGGLVATVLSEAPGAVDHFEGGFVVYTAEHKHRALKVDEATIERCGTVSAEVVSAMVAGALERSNADIAVAVTGVAGPDSDEKGNPVGRVFFGCGRRGSAIVWRKREFGELGRARVRYAAASQVLLFLNECLDGMA